jgi:hypothetical protein
MIVRPRSGTVSGTLQLTPMCRQLYPLVREQVTELLNNYVRAPRILTEIDGYIVPPWPRTLACSALSRWPSCS